LLIGLKLPFHFDPERLKQDLQAVRSEDWSPHYNQGDYGGDWSGAALRSPAGSSHNLNAALAADQCFADTALLNRCPYISEVLSVFECPLKAVRLLSLAPGAYIREHTDDALDYEDGEIRIHIPIQTNPGLEFYVAGERLQLDEGECYYVNVNLPHRVNNRGAADRVHLVIDAAVNAWVHDLFRRGSAEAWHIPRSPLPPRSFEEFRGVVLETPALRERLRCVVERTEFVTEAIRIGRELSYEFNEADVDAGLRSAQPTAPGDPSGWTPVKVWLRESRPIAEWIYTGDRPFTEPFFDETIRAAMREPFTALSRVEMPLDAAERMKPMAPSGFIYHISRCGSTLAAQMLHTLCGARVISEPGPFDEVIQAGLELPQLTRQQHAQWLRWVASALGQRRTTDADARYFIKLDSWHIHDLPLIHEAFPETPWVFLHRDPEQVLASQSRSPGMQAAPGAMDPRALRLTFEDITKLDREQWSRRVITGFLAAAEAFRGDPQGLFVDYSELPDAMWNRVAPHFGLSLSGDDIARMREVARYDSKNPAIAFQPACP
jgi:hypothetical protein